MRVDYSSRNYNYGFTVGLINPRYILPLLFSPLGAILGDFFVQNLAF